jgi:hypothetical protein
LPALLDSKREVQNERGDQALYFDKLSQKQEILMKSGSLERRESALKLPLF